MPESQALSQKPLKRQERKRLFAVSWIAHKNGTQAAKDAGYAEKSAAVSGSRMLRDPEVQAMIREMSDRAINRAELSAAAILEEIRRIALSDPRALFDANGNLRPVPELSDDEAACVAGIEVVKRNMAGGDGKTEDVIKIKRWDKNKALEMAAKHLGLFEETVTHQGRIELRWEGEAE